ncbi:hypothetical protein MLGJGCBP_06648 [Rhodococcus sp. T7]|nr:hypothetical protein MLGJGCBP_06648 [Rhodococcus sp. T7]
MSLTRVHSPAPSLEPVTVGHAELRSTLGSFPSGIAALCAAVDDESVGLVATSFSVGVSYDPPLVLFSIQNSSQTWPRLRTAQRLGISILGEGQDTSAHNSRLGLGTGSPVLKPHVQNTIRSFCTVPHSGSIARFARGYQLEITASS